MPQRKTLFCLISQIIQISPRNKFFLDRANDGAFFLILLHIRSHVHEKIVSTPEHKKNVWQKNLLNNDAKIPLKIKMIFLLSACFFFSAKDHSKKSSLLDNSWSIYMRENRRIHLSLFSYIAWIFSYAHTCEREYS